MNERAVIGFAKILKRFIATLLCNIPHVPAPAAHQTTASGKLAATGNAS